MSRKTYESTGTTEDGATIVLDTPLPVRGRVRVQVEPESRAARREAVLQAIRLRQQARGHQPMSREEIDAYLCESRAEDERATSLSG
ncbi:MAG: hypothetical protein N2554_00650 [Fimbriimonadales bacterium]|nr:hypothetical protein [Fimbriimonadales bacterium]